MNVGGWLIVDRPDASRNFMTQNRWGFNASCTRHGVKITSTQSTAINLDQRFSPFEAGNGNLGQHQGLTRLMKDGRQALLRQRDWMVDLGTQKSAR